MREQIDEEAEAVRAAAFSAVIDDGRHDIKTFLGNKATMEGGGGRRRRDGCRCNGAKVSPQELFSFGFRAPHLGGGARTARCHVTLLRSHLNRRLGRKSHSESLDWTRFLEM